MMLVRGARLAGIVALILLLYFVVPVGAQPRGGMVLRVGETVVVLGALAALVLTQVRLSLATPDRRADGLVGAIVTVWAVFSLTFYILQLHRPDEVAGLHTRVDALYFAASTMLTIGYGDIHATGQVARILVIAQMGFDVVFVAAAASLISARLHRAASRGPGGRRRPGDPGDGT